MGDGTSDTDCWLMNIKQGGATCFSFSLSLSLCMCEWTDPGLVTWSWLEATGDPPPLWKKNLFPVCDCTERKPLLASNANTLHTCHLPHQHCPLFNLQLPTPKIWGQHHLPHLLTAPASQDLRPAVKKPEQYGITDGTSGNVLSKCQDINSLQWYWMLIFKYTQN